MGIEDWVWLGFGPVGGETARGWKPGRYRDVDPQFYSPLALSLYSLVLIFRYIYMYTHLATSAVANPSLRTFIPSSPYQCGSTPSVKLTAICQTPTSLLPPSHRLFSVCVTTSLGHETLAKEKKNHPAIETFLQFHQNFFTYRSVSKLIIYIYIDCIKLIRLIQYMFR